jgi:hypothetical protein
MPAPPCRRLGRQCRALDVTLRVAVLEGQEDHDGTWLLGHVERIEFGRMFIDDDELWIEARLHVPCRHLDDRGEGAARCKAHGFRGTVDELVRLEQPRRLGGDKFRVVDHRRLVTRTLPHAPERRRHLPMHPVVPDANPCATAPCRTSDNVRGAACCRDLQVEIRCTEEQDLLEALLRNRKSPYLCKVEREDDDDELLNVEVLSACGYLLEDGLHCSLHGRRRADGRPAKPELCSKWPEKRTGLHPGCAFRNPRVPL